MRQEIKKNITIIGGNGGMGQLFAKYWHNHNIQILSRNEWNIADTLLKNADLVVVTVPISITEKVIKDAAKFMSDNSILMDFTSIKKTSIETMLMHHKGSVIGLHPMFGPTITSPGNQIIINCGGRCVTDISWVIDSLNTCGFKIIEMSPEKHDEIMGFVQGIEHFSTFMLGNFLKESNIKPQDMFEVSSPIYQNKLALMGRIFAQDPALYADITMPDDSRINLIIKYIDYLQKFKELLINKNKAKFIELFTQVSDWMGDFTSESQLATDNLLLEMDNIYKKILQNKAE